MLKKYKELKVGQWAYLSYLFIAIAIILFFIAGSFSAPKNPQVKEDRPKKEVEKMIGTKAAAESINTFAFDLYAKLRGEEGNTLYSPYSISTALAMAYAGARSKTAAQMENVLHLDTKKEVHSSYSSLISAINSPRQKDSYRLTTANALWLQKGYTLQKEFLNILLNQYGSELSELDFQSKIEDSRIKINKWVEKKTQEKIKDLLQKGTIDSITRLILTNAIYFKAAWAEPFLKSRTKDELFHITSDKKVEVPMMNQRDFFKYFENKEIQLLALPYRHRELSMFVFLPKEMNGLKDVGKSLTSKSLNSWMEKAQMEEVIVSMPKFKITSTFNLNKVLGSMGMEDALSLPQADFSGITGGKDLFISGVIHKAYVDVNEEGTEAAAATAVVMGVTAAPSPPTPKVFRADHPFLFLIRENQTGTILFMGRVINPKG